VSEQQIRLIYAHAEHGEEVPLADTQCIKISLVLITCSLSSSTHWGNYRAAGHPVCCLCSVTLVQSHDAWSPLDKIAMLSSFMKVHILVEVLW